MRKVVAITINSLKSGGAEKQSILLANALLENYEVYYIVVDWKYTVSKLEKLLDPRLNLIKLDGFSLKSILKVYKALKGKGVEHMFAFLTMATVFSVIVSKFLGVKKVYGSVRNSRLPRLKTIIELVIANWLSSKTIHNSYSGEKYFKSKGMKNTLVIPNCYVDMLHAYERKVRETVKIITIGRFVEQKDYGTALKAIHSLSSLGAKFEFVIIGWGELETFIRDTVAEYNLDNVVTIHINPPNVSELLHDADIYLSTSLFEGTSNAIMEAMDESLPIVATDAGDNRQLVKNELNGYICNVGDSQDIATRLNALIEDPSLRNVMGLTSNQILRESYSETIFKERYIHLIEGK